MKLPIIEGYSYDFQNENKKTIDKRILNHLKVIKPIPLKSIHKYFDTEKKSISVLNLRKKNLDEESKIIPNNSYMKSNRDNTINQKKIKIMKRANINNNKNHIYLINSDNINEINTNNNYNDSIFTENRFQTLINGRSSFINNRNENDKLNLPIVPKILKNFERKNRLNQSDIINNRNNKIKKEKYVRYIFSSIKDKTKSKQLHEYNIKFNNSLLNNINWKNNILRRILKNKKIKINMEAIKKYKFRNKKVLIDKEKEKEKEKKNQIIFKSINNESDNSYFNSEINNFYNNCKYKNKKLILSIKKSESISSNQRIFLDRFNDNVNNNYIPSLIEHKKIPNNENKGNILLYEKNKSNSSNVSFNSKYKI